MGRGGASEDHNSREGYSKAGKYIFEVWSEHCCQDNDPEEFLLNLTVETTILGQITLQKDSYTLSEKASESGDTSNKLANFLIIYRKIP